MSSSPTEARHEPASANGRREALLLVGVLAATLLVFARALGGELVYDDLLLIERNPRIAGFGELWSLVSKPYWDFLRPEDALQIGYWRPLTALANAVGWSLGGGEAWAFHAISVTVHLAATAAAYLFVRRLTASTSTAALAALLFGVHPVHVESVAWISALNDPLFGLFALLALERFLAWRRRGSRGAPWLAALAFAFALASKELGAAVLPACLALDLARREKGALVRAYAPFALVLAAYLTARVAVFGEWSAGFGRETTGFGVGPERLALLRFEMLGGALELLLLPLDLRLFRSFRPDHSLTSPAVLRALGWTLAAAIAGWILWRRRVQAGLFALLLIPAALSPALVKVSSLGRFPLSDRFLYVPALGFALGLVVCLGRFVPRRGASLLVLAIAALYGIKSLERIGTWRDDLTLFEVAARETPRDPYVQWGLGRAQLNRFQRTQEPALLDAAFATFERAQDLLLEVKAGADDLFASEGDFLQANLGLAWCWIYRGKTDPEESYGPAIGILEALAAELEEIGTRTAEARRSGFAIRDQNLELEDVYAALGSAYLLAGREKEGLETLRRALRLNPGEVSANQFLAEALKNRGDHVAARRYYERVLAQVPRSPVARLGLANCDFEAGRLDQAERAALALREEGVSGAEPSVLLAVIALERGDPSGALEHLDRALALDPKHGYAWYHRGNAFLALGRADEALKALRRAAELLPDTFETNYQFGAFLLQTGAVEAAMPYLVRAYALSDDPGRLAALRQVFLQLPDAPFPLFVELARIDTQRDAFDTAESWLDQASALGPETEALLTERGRLLRARGRDEEALEVLEQRTRVAPESYEAWSELGAVLAKLERTSAAIDALERARKLGPPAAWPESLKEGSREALARRLAELAARAPGGD